MLQQPVSKVDAGTQCEAEEVTTGGEGPSVPVPSADLTNDVLISAAWHGTSGATFLVVLPNQQLDADLKERHHAAGILYVQTCGHYDVFVK